MLQRRNLNLILMYSLSIAHVADFVFPPCIFLLHLKVIYTAVFYVYIYCSLRKLEDSCLSIGPVHDYTFLGCEAIPRGFLACFLDRGYVPDWSC